MKPIDQEFLHVFADEAKTLLLEWDRSLAAFQHSGFEEHIDVLFRITHNLKGTARSVGLHEFASFAHEVENALKHYKESHDIHYRNFVPLLRECQNFFEGWVDRLKEAPQGDGSSAPLVEKLRTFIQATSKSRWQFSGTRRQKRGAKKRSSPSQALASDEEKTIRVSDAKLEDLAYLLRGLTRQQIRLQDMVKQNSIRNMTARKAIKEAHKLVQSMEAILQDLRLQPAQNLLMRLERIALDLARQEEKHIEVIIEGGETLVDASIMERVADSLGHIVRNAVDHGVEPLTERLQTGKPEISVLKLAAFRDGSQLIFEISDDGRGLDEERIRQSAVRKGLLSKEFDVPIQQIHALIFEPGFSTAERITEVSGRGVGLDVVQKALLDLDGKILLETSAEGTVFRLVVPDRASADKKRAA